MTRKDKATFMTGSEYRKTLQKLGMTVHNSAAFLQIDRSTSHRRANGEVEIGFETAALLKLMARLHLKPEHVTNLVLTKKEAR